MKYITAPEAKRLCRAIRYYRKFATGGFKVFWDKLMWKLLKLCKHDDIASSNPHDGLLRDEEAKRLFKKFET